MQHQISLHNLDGKFNEIKNYFNMIESVNKNMIKIESDRLGIDKFLYTSKIFPLNSLS